jgi:glycosyltransferase involved in cell wall biosynthesis
VTYYNKGDYLPQLLDCLERQTIHDFTVYIVDDGSTEPESIAIFDRMGAQYAARGWTFVRQQNQWVDAARNSAARLGKSEYILFIDADDIPALNTVERYLQAIRTSGDDLLTCGSYLFVGEKLPYDIETGDITAPPFAHYMPLGANLVAGLVEPMVFGSPMIIVRRTAFEAIGGYREWRGAQHEDWELHARLALAGFKTDVVPEYLQFYRQVESGLARTSDQYRAKQRIIEAYEEQLSQIGMRGAAWAFFGMYNQIRALEQRKVDIITDMRIVDTPFHIFHRGWGSNPDMDARIPAVRYLNARERIIERIRDMYRRAVPLETRLKLHAQAMKLLGRKVDPTP